VAIEGRAVMLCRSGGELYALDDLCPHSGARLALGSLAGRIVACPLHGARFDLATGACLSPRMGLAAVVAHEVRVVDGWIEVALSETPATAPLT
jgi:3-phenylpropionate/trans-cinnamate dioxygenase ferredoxin subunit